MVDKKNKCYDVKHLISLIIVCLILILWNGSIDISKYPNIDAHSYKNIAEGNISFTDSPFCYRILGPTIVSFLPLSSNLGFRLFSSLLIILVAITFYVFLIKLNISSSASFLTIIIFLCNKNLIGFLAWNYFQVPDLLGFLSLILLFITMKNEQWLFFSLIFLFGLLSRETAILIIPSLLIYVYGKKPNPQQWINILMSIAPGLFIAMALRLYINPSAQMSLLDQLSNHATKWLSAEVWLRTLFNAWIPIALLPIIYLNTTKIFLQKNVYIIYLIPSVLFSSSFGGDNERLLLPAAIVIYPIIANIIELNNMKAIFAFLIIASFISLPHHMIGIFNVPNRMYSLGFSVTGTIIATIAGLWLKRTYNNVVC